LRSLPSLAIHHVSLGADIDIIALVVDVIVKSLV